MSFRSLALKASFNTSQDDFASGFFVPVLSCAERYDRAVGFFTSGWLRENCRGVAALAANGGTARWVTSPILDAEDWEAMQLGVSLAQQQEALEKLVDARLDDIEAALEADLLGTFATMIADRTLQFRLAVPRIRLSGGDFHTKLGVFRSPSGDRIAFAGSYNDTAQGHRNYESIHVYWSWNANSLDHIVAIEQEFERMWLNLDPNVRTYDLPEAARERITRIRDRSRAREAGTELPDVGVTPTLDPSSDDVAAQPILREYQEEAVRAWFDNGCRGLLEMATGTGKTITALEAVRRRVEHGERRVVLVVAPYSHLVDQWASEVRRFGFQAIQVGSSHGGWEEHLSSELRRFARGSTDAVVVATTIGSLLVDRFAKIVGSRLRDVLLIADEAHNLGAPRAREWLSEFGSLISDRLALTATPIRQFDEAGNEFLLEYFGGTVFEFGLDKAIGTYLTEYDYYPVPVELSDEEFSEYSAITRQLGRFGVNLDGGLAMPDAAKRLLIKRARLLNNAAAKLWWIKENVEAGDFLSHTLFYSGDRLFHPLLELLGVEKRLRVHEFTGEQSLRERRSLLKRFSDGSLQALVAMKCLDEGVDVPPTRTAYFLASSGNAREFVQRRGRVLRRYPGKGAARITDLVAIPPMATIRLGNTDPDSQAVRSAFCRELRRVREFCTLARNGPTAFQPFFELALRHSWCEEVLR